MRQIKFIFVHCTASSQKWGVKELLAEFKAKGWKNPGYHKAAINALEDIEEVEAYEFTGYPDKLSFQV